MPSTAAPLALTLGDPAGIGPDLAVQLAQAERGVAFVCIGDREALLARAAALALPLKVRQWRAGDAAVRAPGTLSLLHCPLAVAAVAGRPDPRNARAVLATLDAACDGTLAGVFAGIVTLPVSKAVICEGLEGPDRGPRGDVIAFSGHTEYFAERTGTPRVVMMLVAGELRVALATTHLPLRRVPEAIDGALLDAVIAILARELRERFGIAAPRILCCGLNPHAGEGGHLGDEEISVIAPALERARARGIDIVGPLPADTLFTPRHLAGSHAVLAMYHDQGLPVLKHAGFGEAVNVTLGLPLVRTSVDHGTAFELAGSGRAEAGSARAALTLAAALTARKAPPA